MHKTQEYDTNIWEEYRAIKTYFSKIHISKGATKLPDLQIQLFHYGCIEA